MSRLLVSVRNKQEAAVARQAGVSIIDVKEPDNGSLGAASIETIHSIAELCGNSIELSVALGELVDVADPLDFINSIPHLNHVKMGLSKTLNADWRSQWVDAMSVVQPPVQPVLVAYADAKFAGSPPITELLEFGMENRVQTLLIDTFGKQDGNLLSHQDIPKLAELIQDATEAGIDIAIAGSLDKATIAKLLPLSPTIVAVRGAVCQGSRTGPIDCDMIAALQASITDSNRNKTCRLQEHI